MFITFVTYNRKEILLHNIQLLRNSFKQAALKFKFEIIAISILKEHCHVILAPENHKDIFLNFENFFMPNLCGVFRPKFQNGLFVFICVFH